MQRIITSAWALGPIAVLLAQAIFVTGCMSLRHKVDPVNITLNVKLENVDSGSPRASASIPSQQTAPPPKTGAGSR